MRNAFVRVIPWAYLSTSLQVADTFAFKAIGTYGSGVNSANGLADARAKYRPETQLKDANAHQATLRNLLAGWLA